ncbi:MAG: hypothetical protein WBA17_12945, partial [Saprospiraceae bacterium]
MLLFEAIDRRPEAEDSELMEQVGLKNEGQLSNLKRNLHRQIMSSLRLIYAVKHFDIEIREQIDFARILYGKGLYLDALRTLEKVKSKAEEHNQDLLHLEIIEFQKLIEARHVTRSRQEKYKLDELIEQSSNRNHVTLLAGELFNVNIQTHGYYIEHGHVRTSGEREAFERQWQDYWHHLSNTPELKREATFFEITNHAQADMWRHYILLDFSAAREAALTWKAAFTNSDMPTKDPDLFIRAIYYAGMFNYLLGDARNLNRQLRDLVGFVGDNWEVFNENSRQIAYVYAAATLFNLLLLRREYETARTLAPVIEEASKLGGFAIDSHRQLQFTFKYAA